jgi:hypothetical protein
LSSTILFFHWVSLVFPKSSPITILSWPLCSAGWGI